MRPADGERRAISGYHNQYRLSAHIIYRHLRDGDLDWIRVADPDAGRVDDCVVGTSARVDGYQVKWKRDGGTFRFRQLISREGATPALIAQLFDGWERLSSSHPHLHAKVYFISNAQPSSRDHIPLSSDGSATAPFSRFLSQAWNPIQNHETGAPEDIPSQWSAAWERLIQASGADSDRFWEFAGRCGL